LDAPELEQEQHFRAKINLAWQKLNDYYALTDNTPIYVAAVVLHPRCNVRWLEKTWSYRPNWISFAKSELQIRWTQYSQIPNCFSDSSDEIVLT
jgi:hypothetical protein